MISKAIGKIFRLNGHSLYFTLTVLIVVADCGDGAAIPAVVVVVIIIGALILFLVVVIVFAVVAYSCNACIFQVVFAFAYRKLHLPPDLSGSKIKMGAERFSKRQIQSVSAKIRKHRWLALLLFVLSYLTL